MGIALIAWSCLTLYLLSTIEELFKFLTSIKFVAICVGYIIILAVYFMFKDVFKEEQY